jgi:glucose/arabinose dehydrogenase
VKRTITISTIAILALLLLSPAAARAQAEHAPDNYGVSNAAPMTSNSPAKTDFQGSFSLDKEAQCAGHKLAAGKYTIQVKTVGENKMVTLQRDGKDIVLTVRKATPPTDSGHSAVLVRHGPGPGGHTVEAVYVESLNLVFILDESGCTKQADKMFAGIKRTPISPTN